MAGLHLHAVPHEGLKEPGVAIIAQLVSRTAWSLPRRAERTCLLRDEWIKMWCIYTTGYYSARKKNEMMLFLATWIGLEITILSEVGQKEKDKHYMIAHICGI